MMAVRKANAAQTFLITRPNTGANATELFAHDIISKYTCHAGGLPSASDEEREQLRKAWTLEYESSHNQDNGGRLKRLGLVAGNVLPLWPALAQTVAERAVEMTKEDQRLRAVRVVLPSETIVGVRFPTHVLNTLRAALAQRSRQRAAHARQHVRAEPPTPVDAAKLRAATTPPKTIQSFFKKKSDDQARLGRRSRRSRRRRRRSGRRPRSAAPLPPSARRRRPAATCAASSRPRPRSPRRKSRRPRTSSSTSTRSPGPAPSAPTPIPRPRRASSSARRAARAAKSSLSLRPQPKSSQCLLSFTDLFQSTRYLDVTSTTKR